VQIAHAGMAALSEAMRQGQEIEELNIRSIWRPSVQNQNLFTDQDFLLLVREHSPALVGRHRAADAEARP
jgi:hypothetical protein